MTERNGMKIDYTCPHCGGKLPKPTDFRTPQGVANAVEAMRLAQATRTTEERSAAARKAANARWGKDR